MPITNHFYNGTTRRYIALFGSLFNKMSITRNDLEGNETQRMIVPISYGPFQKFLAKIVQDPGLNRPQAISLPRMSFEMVSMSYDGSRKTSSLNRIRTNNQRNFLYSPAPYNIEFNLYIMTKYAEDGAKIIEQILPFFKPEYTFTARIIDDIEAIDIPLVLNSINAEDLYEADFDSRRTLMWTLSFTMKSWFFGPERIPTLIKFADVRLYENINTDLDPSVRIVVKPGLTANGEPTSIDSESIPYQEIQIDDDWGVITIIQDIGEITDE